MIRPLLREQPTLYHEGGAGGGSTIPHLPANKLEDMYDRAPLYHADTVHIGVAYVDHRGQATDRAARTLRAISTLGVSVTAGAASTAGACIFLFPATILFLPKFGAFMFTAVAVAFVYALCGFSALLATFGPIGPVGEQPSLPCFAVKPVRDPKSKHAAANSLDAKRGAAALELEPAVVSVSAASSLSPSDAREEQSSTTNEGDGGAPNCGVAVPDGNREMRPISSSSALPTLPTAEHHQRRTCGDWRCVAAFLLLMAALLGSVSALEFVPGSGASADEGAARAEYHMPDLSTLPQGVWEEMRPAGETRCSRGSPYAFFVRPGRSDRVILEFMGGGACWSAKTCGLQKATFRENVEDLRTLFAAGGESTAAMGAQPPSPPTQPAGTGDYLESGLADRAGGCAVSSSVAPRPATKHVHARGRFPTLLHPLCTPALQHAALCAQPHRRTAPPAHSPTGAQPHRRTADGI